MLVVGSWLGSALVRTVYSALAGSVLVSAAMGATIYGFTRAADMRRSGRTLDELAFGFLAMLGAAVCLAAVAVGLILMARKG